MRTRSVSVATLAAVVLSLPLTACTGDDGATPTETVTVTVAPEPDGGDPSASPTATEAPDEAAPLPDEGPDDDAPFVANTEPDTEDASDGARLVNTDMRFGRHDGYDRIVLDLDGAGAPGWRAQYVDSPLGQASGEVIDVDGGAYIDVLIQGIMYPGEEEGQPEYTGPAVIAPPAGGAIREVRWAGIFEGTLQLVIGVESEQPFRVFMLEDPLRVVVDVQH